MKDFERSDPKNNIAGAVKGQIPDISVLQTSFFQTLSFVAFLIIVGICGPVDISRDTELLTRVGKLGMDIKHAG